MFRIFLILVLIVSCTKESTKSSDNTKDNIIAYLINYKNDVEYKEKNLLEWKAVSDNLTFASYDRVKTGADSSAQVEFTDHSLLNINPHSIAIIIDRVKDKEDLSIFEINKGSVQGKLLGSEKGKKVLEIRNKHQNFLLKNKSLKESSFQISLQDKDIKIKSPDNIIVEVNKKEFSTKKAETIISSKKVLVNKSEKKPFYILNFPKKDLTVKKKTINVTGETHQYQVLLNGKLISKAGKFNTQFNLNPGLNILTFQFVGQDDVKFKVIKVTFE